MVEQFKINPKSRSEQILESRGAPPEVTVPMYRAVSDYRKNELADEVDSGIFREGSAHLNRKFGGGDGRTQAGVVAHSGKGLYKHADAFSGSSLTQAGPTSSGIVGTTSTAWRGSGGTVRQVPEVYSPLWLNSNLNLPRDRATVLAWCRSFFALNPIVQNSLTLHSTYPISKLSIKCRNEKVEKFFAGMIEEIDLMNICVQIAQEYWTLGEAFVYAELDDRTAKWGRLLLQNPDYITVKRSAIAGEPIISMRPDENLRRIVTGNRPSDIEQRRQLDPAIIEHVRRGENIPLNNFYVTHLARRISPYEIRGTGLPVSVFRQLMLFDCLRECYSSDTEVLTRDGFKNIKELIKITNDINVNSNYVNGAIIDNNEVKVLTLNDDVEIACYNQKNGEIEYHKPEEMHMSNYNGKMLHFKGEKVDCLVTPNHKMFVKEKHWKHGWGNFELRKASQLLEKKKWYKFKCNAKWTGKHIDTVNVCGKEVDANLYLKFLGYLISEGCVYKNYENGRYDAVVILSQSTASDCYNDMRNTLDAFAKVFDKNSGHSVEIKASSYSAHKPQEMWEGKIHGKGLINHFLVEVGNGETAKSHFKRIPRWALELETSHLKVLLNALVKGDGSETISKFGTSSVALRYSTVSKQLADDVYELVLKCGFAPNMCISEAEKDGRPVKEYIVLWSTTEYGNEPNIYTGNQRDTNNGGGATVEEVDYNDVVWCFAVPTGSFITRRNNKISIHGNSKFAQAHNMVNPLTLVKIGNEEFKPTPTDLDAWRDVFEAATYDKDFKIFTHNAVTVERVGYATGIYDISGDITQLIKEIYIGLMVPAVLMDGQDTTYANGSVALDVLRQRYMQFRNMMGSFLKRKIFAPIAKLNDFYEYIEGEKVLMVPDVDWNHMSLFDMADYIGNLTQLSQSGPEKKVSLQTLYRSLGLDYNEERRKMRYEDINDAIRTRELDILSRMPLNKLRSLSADDEIKELAESPLPGETPYEEPAGSGAGGLDEGGLPGAPTSMSGGLGGMSMPAPKPPSAPVGGGGGRPSGLAPQPPGGGTGIGPGGIPKPTPPAK